jgi:hypothetical protein
MTLSSTKFSHLITELAGESEEFAALSSQERINLINAATQMVVNDWYNANLLDYLDNTLDGIGVLPTAPDMIRRGSTVADIAGTAVPYTEWHPAEPFDDTNYFVLADGQKGDDHVGVDVTIDAADEFTLFPSEDGTTVNWIAVGF